MANRGLYGLPSVAQTLPGYTSLAAGAGAGAARRLVPTPATQFVAPNSTSPQTNGRAVSTSGPTLDRVWVFPFPILRGYQYTNFGFSVAIASTGGSGSVARVGLYRREGTLTPGLLIFDGGTIACDSGTGFKLVGIPYIDNFGDWIWVAVAFQVSVAALTVRTSTHNGQGYFGAGCVANGEQGSSQFHADGITGALPQRLPTLTRSTASAGLLIGYAY